MKNETKVTLATNDTLKCPACGNRTFSIKQKNKEMDGKAMTVWAAVCDDCGLMMKFHKEIKEKQ